MNFCFLLPGLWLTLAVFAMTGGAGIAVSMSRIRHRGNRVFFLMFCICAIFSVFLLLESIARIPGLFESLHSGTAPHFLMAALLTGLAFLLRRPETPEYCESAIKDAAGQSLVQLSDGALKGEFRNAARLLKPLPVFRFKPLILWLLFGLTVCLTLVSAEGLFPESGLVAVWLTASGVVLVSAVSAACFSRSPGNSAPVAARGFGIAAAYFLLSAFFSPCLSEIHSVYGLASYTQTTPSVKNIISEPLFYGACALLFLSGIRFGQGRRRS